MILTNELVRKLINKPVYEKNLESYVRLYPKPLFVEPKIDGERVLILVENGKITMANRYSAIYTEENLPDDLYDEMLSAFIKDGLYDAEYYCLSGDFYEFEKARNRLENLGIAIFDVLMQNGKSIHTEILEKRKEILANSIDLSKSNNKVILLEFSRINTHEEIIELFNHYVNQGYEGIVVKPNSWYSMKWVKLKKTETVDVVILGIKKTKDFLESGIPRSFLIGFYRNGKFEPYGFVSSGLKAEQKVEIFDKLEFTREDSKVFYCKPTIVLEVEYQDKLANGFRSPRIKRVRYDKHPTECVSFRDVFASSISRIY